MLTKKDVKVAYRKTDSTFISGKWTTYFFSVAGKPIFPGIRREDTVNEGVVFKFWAEHCKTLDEAKQYIADYVNKGGNIYKI